MKLSVRWLFCGTVALAAPAKDLVDSLPGWDRPLLSKTYAGYIDVGSKDNATHMFEHYLFFESEGDPSKDPLIMWTNGGPGASSLFGSFSELGPYYLTDASMQTSSFKATGVPTLFKNDFRWTRLGNLIIRNLPPPIGFSYCDPVGPSGDGYSCGPWNDTSVAQHSYLFMKNWMEAFPEYKGRDLYLIGESYAGLYVPMLAKQIVDNGGGLGAQLKGIAVGDGCTSGLGCTKHHGPYFYIEFMHGHGQISTKTYLEIKRVCSEAELFSPHPTAAGCAAALNKMQEEQGYVFAYGLYDECYDFALGDSVSALDLHSPFGRPAVRESSRRQQRASVPGGTWHMDGSPCGGTGVLPHWANTPAVKKALHVAADAHFFTGDNGVGFTYKGTEPDVTPWYKEMAQKDRLRILIYNGDTDPWLNSFVGENWTVGLGLEEKESWRPWTRDGKIKMGGYVTRYEGSFDYLTIRGSGHMVPEFKPEAAFVFLRSFLHNQDYPRFVKPSRQGVSKSADIKALSPSLFSSTIV